MCLSPSRLPNTFRWTRVGQLTASSRRPRGVTAACGGENTGWQISPAQLSQNVSPECFYWVESWAGAGKRAPGLMELIWLRRTWCSVFNTGFTLSAPNVLALPSRPGPFPSLPYHLPPRMSYHTCLHSHCDLTCSQINYATRGRGVGGRLYCCASIPATRPAGKEQLAPEGFLRSVTGREKSADVSTFSSGSQAVFSLDQTESESEAASVEPHRTAQVWLIPAVHLGWPRHKCTAVKLVS